MVTARVVLKPATPDQLAKLRVTGRALLSSGVILLAVAPACGLTAELMGLNGNPNTTYFIVAGIAALGGGLGLTITGGKKLSLYRKYKKYQATLNITGTGMGLALAF